MWAFIIAGSIGKYQELLRALFYKPLNVGISWDHEIMERVGELADSSTSGVWGHSKENEIGVILVKFRE